jgi:hypothetical protein
MLSDIYIYREVSFLHPFLSDPCPVYSKYSLPQGDLSLFFAVFKQLFCDSLVPISRCQIQDVSATVRKNTAVNFLGAKMKGCSLLSGSETLSIESLSPYFAVKRVAAVTCCEELNEPSQLYHTYN